MRIARASAPKRASGLSEIPCHIDHKTDADPDDQADKPVTAAGKNGAELVRTHDDAIEGARGGAADRRHGERTVVALLDAMLPDLLRAEHMGTGRLLRAAMRAARCAERDRRPAIVAGNQLRPR